MATESGKNGKVTVNSGDQAECTNWKLKRSGNLQAWGSSSSGGWKKRLSGTKDWSGSFEMKEEPSFEEGDTVTLALYRNATQAYTGEALIADISTECDIDNGAPNGWTISFEGNGPIT
jgi:predicted secreted protein